MDGVCERTRTYLQRFCDNYSQMLNLPTTQNPITPNAQSS